MCHWYFLCIYFLGLIYLLLNLQYPQYLFKFGKILVFWDTYTSPPWRHIDGNFWNQYRYTFNFNRWILVKEILSGYFLQWFHFLINFVKFYQSLVQVVILLTPTCYSGYLWYKLVVANDIDHVEDKSSCETYYSRGGIPPPPLILPNICYIFLLTWRW